MTTNKPNQAQQLPFQQKAPDITVEKCRFYLEDFLTSKRPEIVKARSTMPLEMWLVEDQVLANRVSETFGIFDKLRSSPPIQLFTSARQLRIENKQIIAITNDLLSDE